MNIERFNPNIEEETEDNNQEHQEHYSEKETINGIEISVGWDRGSQDYTIYLPQIKIGEKEGVYDQVIRISENKEDAKEAFTFATQKAQDVEDAYDLYKELENFAAGLREKEEE